MPYQNSEQLVIYVGTDKISVSGNINSTKDLSKILSTLQDNVDIKYIDLRSANVKSSMMYCISSILRGFKNIEKLSLGWNDLLPLGSYLMVPVLKSQALKYLDVSNCRIGDFGLKGILEALKGSTSMQGLGIMGNSITDIGAAHIARFLGENRSLPVLKMGGNNITSKGEGVILKSLELNFAVLDLGNFTSSKIDQFIKRNKQIAMKLTRVCFKALAESCMPRDVKSYMLEIDYGARYSAKHILVTSYRMKDDDADKITSSLSVIASNERELEMSSLKNKNKFKPAFIKC